MQTTTRVLDSDDIARAAGLVGVDRMIDELIDRLEIAFRGYDERDTEVPVRNGFCYDDPAPGLVEWMPVLARGRHALMKTVSYHPRNPGSTGLPTILSSLSLIDTATGHLVAISDGTFLTALRTGAASAVATRALADPASRVLGLIGCGAQAVTQLHALSRVLPLELVLFWDTDPGTRHSFPERVARFLPRGVSLRESPLELIVPNVDVLCTATSIDVGAGPLFGPTEVRASLHVNAVGSDFPGKIELPLSLLREATVIPDFAAQAIAEGECQQLDGDEVGPELHRVLKTDGGSSLRNHRTVFDSTGWALEDLVAMELLVEWAGELGVGREVRLECIPPDPKDPYRFESTLDEAATRKAR